MNGIHRIHRRVNPQEVSFGQFQRDRHIRSGQAVGQQQLHAGVRNRHRAQRAAAARHFQLPGHALGRDLGVAGVAGKGIVQQGADIVVFVGLDLALHGHADQPHAVLLRQADIAVPGNVGVADLGTQDGRDIVPAGAHPHFILLVEVPGHGLDIGRAHGVHLVPGKQGLEPGLGQRPAQDLRHVIAAGVVVLIADAVGVGKVGVFQPQLLCLRVHGGHTALNGAAAEVFGQQVGPIVGAGHHGGIQGIGQGHFLPFLQGDMAGIGARQRVDILVADRQLDIVPLALGLFTGKAQRHHLGDGCRVQFLVHVLLGQHQTGVGIDDAVRFRSRQCRPGSCRARRKRRQCGQKHRTQHGDVFFHSSSSISRYYDIVYHIFIPLKRETLSSTPGAPAAAADRAGQPPVQRAAG